MSIPAVIAIRNTYSDARICWLVEGSVSRFLSYQDFVDDVIEFPRHSIVRAIKKSDPIRAIKEINAFLKRLRKVEYDIIADFHGIIKSAIFAKIARGARRIGFGKIYAKEKSHLFYGEAVTAGNNRIHKVERNMLIAHYLGAGKEIPEVKLVVPSEMEKYIDSFFSEADLSGAVFAVNPFSSSGSAYKRWNIKHYGALIKKISNEIGGHVLILWGPGEKKEAEHLRQISGDGALLSCSTDVPQLFALLKKVDMYIGGDTGVMHLAAFAGRPVVAIFGPTDVNINAPFGQNNIIVRKDLPCSPCKNKKCQNRKCVESITVDEVFEAVVKMHKSVHN
ncbi:MAG: glycosyltransferase family 9 protein [Proteobacteria bacterium]|nr:glycosyltransferase family 9 protein [Pseudomonadota bacterium]